MCREEILQNLKCLVSAQFQYIDRTLDLVHLGFGELFEETNRRGEKREIAAYSFHIQCPFRIIRDNNIVLGYTDLFIPNKETDFMVYLNKRNTNVFDSKVEWLESELKNESVKDVCLTPLNDLVIETTNFTIEILVCDQTSESWRFFCIADNSPHIVVDEDGLNC